MLMPFQADPVLLGGRLAIFLAKWVVETASVESAWKFDTDAGGTVGVGAAKYAFVGGATGAVWLKRPGFPDVCLKYLMGGGGVGISPPTQVVTVTESAPSFPSFGQLRILKGERDFNDTKDFTIPNVGLIGPCALLQIDGNLLVGGYSGGVLLLGLNSGVEALLRALGRHTSELMTLIKENPPHGFWSRQWDAFTRPYRMDYDIVKISLDITAIMSRLQSSTWFRAALFFHGAEVAASETLVTASASIAAYFGVVNA